MLLISTRLPRVVGWLIAGAIIVGSGDGRGVAWGKRAKSPKDAAAPTPAASATRSSGPGGVPLNACGCYHQENACVCTNRNARCECPDDCEPVGCDEKRQKEMDREMAVEVKRAQDDDKKRQEAEAARERQAAEVDNGGDDDRAAEADAGTGAVASDGAEGATGKTGVKTGDKTGDKTPVKTPKPARKDRSKK